MEDLRSAITPAFFQRNHYAFPAPHDRLMVLDRSFTLDELRALGTVHREVTLECAGNGRKHMCPQPEGTPWGWGAVSNALWTGVPLARVLERVRLPEDTRELVFQGGDGEFARSLPLEEALRPDVLLALDRNGQPLCQAHGGPLRLLVPGWYAMASVKWLTHIWASARAYDGHYQVNDYLFLPEDGPTRRVTRAQPRAMITSPGQGNSLKGAVEVQGWAWSGFAPVESVEIRVDDQVIGAELGDDRGPFAWRGFSARLELAAGKHRLTALARDGQGNQQPLVAPWNQAGYENNSAMWLEITVLNAE
jgi:DMSO/TMAO reductase YedYZ molybdopterin-dependent catalytic subunit